MITSLIFKNYCMKNLYFFVCCLSLLKSTDEITPHKYTDAERNKGLRYEIPKPSRFTVQRPGENLSDITYYFSRPIKQKFPIAILIGGSSLEDDIISIVHFHRYFLQEFINLNVGVITLEQQGVDGDRVDKKCFMKNYTRSNRLFDHKTVIEHLKKNPPDGWNGEIIFLGVSEGGPIATTLTCDYPEMTLATINWSGAGDSSWRDDLWLFYKNMELKMPWYQKLTFWLYSLITGKKDFYCPKSRQEHDLAMDEAIKNPTDKIKLAGMTYKYHHDVLNLYPKIEYEKIKTPYLVVVGAQDSIIDSADTFVHKAQSFGAPITYMRISDMDHYIRRREDVIKKSFDWLKQHLKK